jgi:hypothetical protein
MKSAATLDVVRCDMVAWTPRLSKSRFQAGLQCPKYLWLECRAPQLADPISESTQAVFDQGHAVGELARRLFPGGVLVEEDYTRADQALETTQCLLGGDASCLYEGAFRYDGVFVRPDALFKEDGHKWTLVEVKSSTEVKPEYITDLGIQTYVLRGAGIPVSSARLLHLDNAYAYPGGPYDLGQLFALEDLTGQVEPFLDSIPGLLRQFRQMLAGPMPDMSISKRCDNPYTCRFHGYCHSYLPEFPVTEIPRVSDELLSSLLCHGYCSIREVPLSYPGLTPVQRTVCDVIQSGQPRFDPQLTDELSQLREPIHFLDFETWRAALPVHPGTRPYQALPVQWSCHTLDSGLHHAEFLHADRTDPRRPFVTSLLAALGVDKGCADESPIVVYTGYENRILAELARDLPEFATPIAAVQARLFDLEKLVRAYVQHPEFHGRTSLKRVLPALVDDLSYDGLAVQDGESATLRWAEAVFGGAPASVSEAIFAELRAYCATDTMAMVRLYEELLKAA